jgi:type I restriction enzyme S subunit
MSKYKPYSKYKDSGVEWLGQVPADWVIKKLLYSSTCNDESLPESTSLDYSFDYIDISSVDLLHGVNNREKIIFSESPSRARRIVRRGDCLVSTVRTYLKAIAPINFDANHVIVSTGFAVIRPKSELNSDFLPYALQSS